MYADIAVCLPLARTFIYKLTTPVETGCRVVVPFRKRDVEGFVVGFRKEAPPDIEVHEIGGVLDAIPLLRPDIFNLCRWVADYYATPIGEVLKAALPPGISAKHVEGLRPSPDARQPAGCRASASPRGRGPSPSGRGRHCEAVPGEGPMAPKLTVDQLRALETVTEAPGFRPILLHGVTGSGQTEIYMQAVEHFLAAGKTSLILVPEIGLTPQLTDQFARRFPNQIAILHSSLTRRQRIDEWLRIYRGEVPIVIGTRSAVFAPLKNLGLIVVDEEHETSYKQEEVPRYHARDTAVVRAKLARAAVVLGSATPSMESFHNAELKHLVPDARVGRIDRDTMRHMRDYERVLGGFRAGDIDILVGTQMIAKGHDFPRVTLVGVVGADAPLALPDFRAAERTFQLLTQVAGRSGRGGRPGEVVIQSYFPDHYTFQLAVTQRFEDFYARESRYRKTIFYPPFTALAGIMVTDRDPDRAATLARDVGEFLDSLRSNAVRILGPAPAPLERIKRVHRHQLLIKSSSRSTLHLLLDRLRQYIEERKIGPTRVIIDVDPVSLL